MPRVHTFTPPGKIAPPPPALLLTLLFALLLALHLAILLARRSMNARDIVTATLSLRRAATSLQQQPSATRSGLPRWGSRRHAGRSAGRSPLAASSRPQSPVLAGART
uniref:Uncharacterized protein n=1 Tax=Haptolina brevifila TaxID=156173 RepID=A0A7S2GK13_9EUKA